MIKYDDTRNRKYRSMQPDQEADAMNAERHAIKAWDEFYIEW